MKAFNPETEDGDHGLDFLGVTPESWGSMKQVDIDSQM
jgi:hypothetical protein